MNFDHHPKGHVIPVKCDNYGQTNRWTIQTLNVPPPLPGTFQAEYIKIYDLRFLSFELLYPLAYEQHLVPGSPPPPVSIMTYVFCRSNCCILLRMRSTSSGFPPVPQDPLPFLLLPLPGLSLECLVPRPQRLQVLTIRRYVSFQFEQHVHFLLHVFLVASVFFFLSLAQSVTYYIHNTCNGLN